MYPKSICGRFIDCKSHRPFVQNFLLGIIIFCGPGLNSTITGLGAGGSRPSEISIVDKLSIITTTMISVTSFFGGSINNQLGPKYTLMLGASGYPIYVGALWFAYQYRPFRNSVDLSIGGSTKVEQRRSHMLPQSTMAHVLGFSTPLLVSSVCIVFALFFGKPI